MCSRSSGPGGQHAQKSETRVEAVFEGPQAYKRGTGWPGGTPSESRPNGQ